MIITAKQTYVRVGAQKLKFVADSVRKLPLKDVRQQLEYMNKEPARRLLETVNQAVENARHNFGVPFEKLAIESLMVLPGPQYKRMRAVSRGQGHAILKRTSHIVVALKTVEGTKEKKVVEPVKEEKPVISEEKTEKLKVEKVVTPKKAVKKAKPSTKESKKE